MSDAYKIYASQEYVDEKIAEIPEGFSGSWENLTDKPFGTIVEWNELIPEKEVVGNNNPDNPPTINQDVTVYATKDDVFKVIYDGEEYILSYASGVEVNGMYWGDVNCIDTPFYLFYVSHQIVQDGFMIHIPDTNSHTVAVYRQKISVISLPEEYLPENTGKCLVLYANNGLLYLDPNWNTMADFTTVSTACQNNYDMIIFIGAGSDDYFCDKVLVSSCREYTKVCTLTTDTIVYTLNENGNWTSAPVDHSMSWNELKDKPFGEVPATVDYYPETTWNGSGSITNGKAYLTYGTTYYVTWDGTEYECVCKGEYMTTYPCIGNASLFYSNGNQDTGEPFCITDKGTSFQIDATDEGEHIFSIKMVGTETKTIEDEYFPSTIQRVGDDLILNSSTEGSTKKFKLTIDDSGVLTATEIVE